MLSASGEFDVFMTLRFAITWDYRCPFARIAHDHVITGLEAGADWDVRFLPFSLSQAHVADDEAPVWERPEIDSGLIGLQLGVAVRDTQPDVFLAAHRALFDYRHLNSGSLRDRDALSKVLVGAGVDAEAVWEEVASGRPLATVRDEHTEFVASHHVWGVPTFLVDDRAVFVRLLAAADGDDALAVSTIERVLDNISWSLLNEFKHTSIPN